VGRFCIFFPFPASSLHQKISRQPLGQKSWNRYQKLF
jgi:hypothetical protein